MTNKNLRLTRSDLATFLPNQRSIRAFETLFVDVDQNNETNIELINEVAISADNAGAMAILALGIIEGLEKLAELSATNPTAQEEEKENVISLIQENANDFDYIDLNPNAPHANKVARLSYGIDDTLNIDHKDGIVQQVGEEIFIQVTNTTGSTILNGSLIGLTGSGTTISLYNANGSVPPMYVLGLATHDIPNGARGRVTQFGRVRDVNTLSLPVGIVYANPTVAGGLTSVKPTAPNAVIPIGVVTSSAVNGQIFVRPILEQQRYYGAFAKTVSVALPAIDTATAITFNTTTVSNGVAIGSPTSRVIASHSGLYNLSMSFQLASTSSSVKDVYLWVRKNGVDIPNSTIVHSLESNSAKTVQSRSMTVSLNANDYIELYWASPDSGVSLSAIAATAFSPAAPSVILSVNQIQQ